MAILYIISVIIQIRQIKISFIPFLAFDQIIIEQERKGLKFRSLAETDSDYVNAAFKLQNLEGGTAKNIDIKVYLNEKEVIREKHINVLPNDKYYLCQLIKKAFEEFKDTIKIITGIELILGGFINLDDKDLYELTFETINN
ncbi:hypothetical protein [Staphylococcus shinii]|uniref:hypothetical protein n=1 Tax=Staphylococcus shinii TaxID=2912228 RepID=UPI003F56A7C2